MVHCVTWLKCAPASNVTNRDRWVLFLTAIVLLCAAFVSSVRKVIEKKNLKERQGKTVC